MTDNFTFQRRLFSFVAMFIFAVLSIALTVYAIYSVYLMIVDVLAAEEAISVGKVLLFGVALMPAYCTYLFVGCARDDWGLLQAQRQ